MHFPNVLRKCAIFKKEALAREVAAEPLFRESQVTVDTFVTLIEPKLHPSLWAANTLKGGDVIFS